MENEKKTFGKWIRTEQGKPETFPEPEQMVLVSCKTKAGARNVNRAYFMDGYWHGSGSMSGVEAWMPLPEPYQEGGENDT